MTPSILVHRLRTWCVHLIWNMPVSQGNPLRSNWSKMAQVAPNWLPKWTPIGVQFQSRWPKLLPITFQLVLQESRAAPSGAQLGCNGTPTTPKYKKWTSSGFKGDRVHTVTNWIWIHVDTFSMTLCAVKWSTEGAHPWATWVQLNSKRGFLRRECFELALKVLIGPQTVTMPSTYC